MSWLSDLRYLLLDCGWCYLIIVGAVYLAVFFLGGIVAAFLPPRTLAVYSRRLRNLFLFLVILLFVGQLFGVVWGEMIWGRFYRSTDYAGIDFLPFLPIRRMVIDAPLGNEPHGLMGITLFQLNLIWFLFALGTWAATVQLYRRVGRGRRSPLNELKHAA